MEHDYQHSQQDRVGITQYLKPGKQIPAITKYLLSDFIVNEIDKHQQLVALASKPGNPPQDHREEENNFIMSEALKQEVEELLGQEVRQGLEKLYEGLDCGEKVGPWEMLLDKKYEKADRVKVHDFVRQRLSLIDSSTLDGKIKLKFVKNLRKMNPNARHKYTYFKLYKYGLDTINAVFRLSKITGINHKLFSTAGLKDKRGHTTQTVSVYNTDLPSIKRFYKHWEKNQEMWIEDFQELKDEKLEVGGLYGNQFGLVLRMLCPTDEEEVCQRVENIKKEGMINYFGLQRFGQFSIKTYQLGAMVLKKQWQTLIESIILSDCGNENINALKREIYQSREFGKADKAIPNKYKIEKLIFKGLSRLGMNHMNVFESLSRSIKTLYVHALQSYIWNRITSRRIKQHGKNLVLHDLVGVKLTKEQKEEQQNANHEQDEQEGEQEGGRQQKMQVIEITAENIEQYSIFDLVGPLYGPTAQVPQSSLIHGYLMQELKELDLQQSDFVNTSKTFCLKGQFRKMLIRPSNVSYKICHHSQPKDEILSPFYTLGEKTVYQDGPLRALQLTLQLPKSAYATMAIRQVLHISSEFSVQMELNKEYETKYALKQPQS